MKWLKKMAAALLAAAISVAACVSCQSDSIAGRLRQNGGLRIGYCSCSADDDAPFVIEDSNQKQGGITGEPASRIADSMGVEPLFSRLSSAEAYDRLMNGSVDCLWNCPPPAKELVSSVRTIETGLYYRQVIMTTADSKISRLADVKGKKLAVVSGSDAQIELHNASVMESSLKKIVVCSGMQQLLRELAAGRVDCAAVDEPQALYAAANFKESDVTFKCVETPVAECRLVIVTRADDADLCSLIAEKYIELSRQDKISGLCESFNLDVLLSSYIKNNPAEAST
ncbi:MAG: transporter substrate-binding domain-containing protein [Clostridia bacterium]|nr:transporter substrate-binding domain-containing protein [Clostridia bacterium]